MCWTKCSPSSSVARPRASSDTTSKRLTIVQQYLVQSHTLLMRLSQTSKASRAKHESILRTLLGLRLAPFLLGHIAFLADLKFVEPSLRRLVHRLCRKDKKDEEKVDILAGQHTLRQLNMPQQAYQTSRPAHELGRGSSGSSSHPRIPFPSMCSRL